MADHQARDFRGEGFSHQSLLDHDHGAVHLEARDARSSSAHAAALAVAKRRFTENRRPDSLASSIIASHDVPIHLHHPHPHGHAGPTDAAHARGVSGGSAGDEDSGDLAADKDAVELDGEPEHKLSPLQASINLVKCAVGAGSFSLPFAFYQGGLAASFATTLVLGALSAYTVILLAQCERHLLHELAVDVVRGRKVQLPWSPRTPGRRQALGSATPTPVTGFPFRLTYPELGARVFDSASLCGVNVMRVVIYAGIVLTSLGVCAAYVDFISGTMSAVLDGRVSPLRVSFMTLPVLLLLALLRSFRYLAFTSLLGDVAVTLGIVSVVINGMQSTGGELHTDLPLFKLRTFAQFVGGTAFLFAIHIVILPIMQSMKEPRAFPTVATRSYAFITVLNAVFGALCYMLFAADTAGNVLDNLTKGAFLTAVRLLLCIDLLFTLPMVLAAGREIVEEAVVAALTDWSLARSGAVSDAAVTSTRNTVRVALVGLVLAIVYGVPEFSDAVQLIGGFVNSLMGFIIPPLVYLRLRSQARRRARRRAAGEDSDDDDDADDDSVSTAGDGDGDALVARASSGERVGSGPRSGGEAVAASAPAAVHDEEAAAAQQQQQQQHHHHHHPHTGGASLHPPPLRLGQAPARPVRAAAAPTPGTRHALLELFPPYLDSTPLSWPSVVGHWVIVVFGVAALVLSTYFSVSDIVKRRQ